MFHGSYCKGYSGQLYCWLFREIYCSYIYRMKREVSAAGKALQRLVMWISRRNPFWQQWGAVRFPPPPAHLCLDKQHCLKPAVVSVSLSKLLALACFLWLKRHMNQRAFPSRCSDFASLIAAFRLERKRLPVQLMDGESRGNSPISGTLQSVEQSSAIDPGSTLELNLEILKA